MSFDTLLNRLIHNTSDVSLVLFLPELTLCATIVVLLLVRLCNLDRLIRPVGVCLTGGLIALVLAGKEFYDLADGLQPATPIFTGLLAYDQFTVFFRLFLITFVILVTALTAFSGIPDLEDGPDFYTLLFGATIGMLLMASTNNLLILFLGVEMASVPSYAMVGFLKGRKQSSEASLKFVVYGAAAAGVMLYGVSLLSGLLGTASFAEMALRITELVGTHGMSDPTVRTVLLGVLMVMVGLAFKLSIVPFHFWCPDAFEGAAAEVAGYLSVASKAAAFALLVRFCRAIVGDHVGGLANLNYALGDRAGSHRGSHLHVRKPGCLFADERQAAAGLLDHRACRLHADGGGRDDGHLERPEGGQRRRPLERDAGHRGALVLSVRVPVHEPGCVRRRGPHSQRDFQRTN